MPVEAHYVGSRNGVNGWASTGLSFGDYQSMSCSRQKIRERRLETPAFMHDERRFRAVVIRYLENKAYGAGKHPARALRTGTEVERSLRLTVAMKKKAEHAETLLAMFATRYLAAADEAERKALQQRILEYDTAIRVYREPWVIPQICRAYYFERLESCVVADRFGFKAPWVRQTLRRLALLDAKMQDGTDAYARLGRKSLQ